MHPIKTVVQILLTLTISLAASLQAQSQLDISARIITGTWDPYKIAVGEFKVAGDSSSEAIQMAEQIRQVITDDLDFHIFFDTISVNQFYVDVWEIEELTPIVWHRMGADYVVEGKVELVDDDVRVEYHISDLNPGGYIELIHEKLKTRKQNFRRLSHMIADEVVKRIAAEEPFFTSRVAFVSSTTGHKELYLCDYDGNNVVRLTNDHSTNLSPAWDRKEEKLLYTSYKRNKQQIWELDIPSGKSRLISNYPVSNNAASISPDNKEIIITLSKDGNAELYVLNRDGEIKRRLTVIPSIEVGASWSPTGNEISFQSDRSGVPQIYIMDSEGLNAQRLTFDGKYNDSPDFSPQGDVIVFVSRGNNGKFQVCTIDVTGKDFTRLDQIGSNENPHWSPDGWHLVYCKRTSSTNDLYIMDRFKKRIKKITDDGKSSNPAWQPFAY